MPQIWLTYDEMGRYMNVPADEARNRAIAFGLDRRKCSDGNTRLKLPTDMIEPYLVGFLVERSVGANATSLDDLMTRLAERLRQVTESPAIAPTHRAV